MHLTEIQKSILNNYFHADFVPFENGSRYTRPEICINWDYIYSIPEFATLKILHQSPKWHSESEFISGHIELVVIKAVEYLESIVSDELSKSDIILLMAAIFHDVGKATTTFLKEKDNMWHHYGHEIESEKITRKILWELGPELREPICQLVRWHMEPFNIIKSKKNIVEKMIDLSYKVPKIELLYQLKRFDMLGSESQDPELTKNDYNLLNSFVSLSNTLSCRYYPSEICRISKCVNDLISDKPKINVELYMGLPGAGKDTSIHNEPDISDKVIVCRDDIRIDLGFCKPGEKYLGTNDEENEVTKEFNKRMVEAAAAGKTIILNNMNNKRKYRDEYKRILKDYNVTWHYIYVEADSLQKNIDRRNGQIPEHVFPKLIENFEFPTFDEYDRLEYIIT
jgi:predicted kinase